ncbi:MAG: PLP-dependent transferase [Prevotella sp.]|nr:PLP-dependent transferase [Prevotella sp.]
MTKKLSPATLCVQGGWQPKNGDPRVLPIIQSTTFKYDNTEEMADLIRLSVGIEDCDDILADIKQALEKI